MSRSSSSSSSSSSRGAPGGGSRTNDVALGECERDAVALQGDSTSHGDTVSTLTYQIKIRGVGLLLPTRSTRRGSARVRACVWRRRGGGGPAGAGARLDRGGGGESLLRQHTLQAFLQVGHVREELEAFRVGDYLPLVVRDCRRYSETNQIRNEVMATGGARRGAALHTDTSARTLDGVIVHLHRGGRTPGLLRGGFLGDLHMCQTVASS